MSIENAAWRRSTDAAIAALLLLVAMVTFSKGIEVGGLRWSDSCSRAMDSVLILDWLSAGPEAWWSPLEFAKRQYAHYPTMSIGRIYPPGFAIVQSVFFAVFGISPFSARLCALSFGLLAVVGCYALGRRFMGPTAAACASGFLMAMPGVIFWSRQAMLEMPALAMLIWTVYAAHGYFAKPTWLGWAAVVSLMVSSVLVKQTSVFIVPVLGVFFVWGVVRGTRGTKGRRHEGTKGRRHEGTKGRRHEGLDEPRAPARGHQVGSPKKGTGIAKIPLTHLAATIVALLLPLGEFFAYTFYSGGTTTHMFDVVSMGKPVSEWISWDALTFYWRTLPRQVGWLTLTLAAVGLLLSLLPSLRRVTGACTCHEPSAVSRQPSVPSCLLPTRWEWWFILTWFAFYYLMCSLIQYKEDRYFFFNYFPLAIWAGRGAATLMELIPPIRVRAIVAGALVLGVVALGYLTPVRFEPDYAPLIAAYEPRIRNKIVLFEGLRDGDFTFAARRQLGKQQCVIVRGSKVFYSCPAIAWFDFKSNVSSTADVAEIIDKFDFELLFVERRNPLRLREVDLLHEELANRDRYELVGSHAMTVPRPHQEQGARIVDVYRPLHRSTRRVRFVDIPIPIDGRTIRVDLDELLAPDA